MRILVDFDGIITDTLPAWLQRIYETTGVRAKPSDILKWNLIENAPLDQLAPWQLLSILNEKDFMLNLPQMADAELFLEKLHKAGHDISIVTARSGDICMSETIAWVRAMLPWLDIKKVWFCHDKHRITGDVIIDDRAETLVAYHKEFPKAKLITIDYLYNKNTPASTKRILNNGYEWEAIESYIKRLSKEQNEDI
jgi:5'(3')-deoxyribonucleotidase